MNFSLNDFTLSNLLKSIAVLFITGFGCIDSGDTQPLSNRISDAPDSTLRVVTYNVWYGFTEAPDRKPEWIEWMVRHKPDVVSLQELNEYTPEKLKADAESWGHPYSVLLKTEGFPTGITSRYPIKDVQRTLEGFHHGLLRVQIKGIYFYVVHLHPGNRDIRMQEINYILEDIGDLPSDAAVVLAGDFNALSRSDSVNYSDGDLEYFFEQRDKEFNEQNLNDGKLDYTVIDKVTKNGFVDTEFLLRPEDYFFTGTFPASIVNQSDHGALRRLDYIFVNEKLISAVTTAKIIANKKTQLLSDHLPVMVDLD